MRNVSVPLSSEESRRASPNQRLLSRADMQGEAGKKYTTTSMNAQKNRQKLSKAAQKTGDY